MLLVKEVICVVTYPLETKFYKVAFTIEIHLIL